ncbi:MAG TPA: Fic family protein [Candidatus Lustribacter sp.]|nr:Fic family protein [Candidatus Lustribacter sp.]
MSRPDPIYLTTEDLLSIADELGGLVVSDWGLLDSAAHRPAASAFGEDAYPDLHLKAAVLLESIARNHALVDGNNRLAWVSTVVFLGLNGVRLVPPEDPAYDLVIAVCETRINAKEVAAALVRWSAS